jgi:ABC-type multidrug transport system ATPase subunit
VLFSRYITLTQFKQARFALEARAKIISSIDESRLRNISYARQAQVERDEYRYKDNLLAVWAIKNIEMHKTCIFSDISWNLEPGVNVLLGRNGFGKSLLLRLLVGLMTYDDDRLTAMTSNSNPEQRLTVGMLRNGEPALIERDQRAFVEAVGKIPVLAIPDSRFINRARDGVSSEGDDKADPARDGARHFLYELPYETRLQTVLTQMCIEYVNSRPRGSLSGGRSRNWLSAPQLDLIAAVIRELSGERFYFVRIEPTGNARFSIEVETDSSPGQPISIQHASQGTLSVVAIFLLVYQFLRASYPGASEPQVCNQSAIVIVDEVDAHLHPAWQRKITDLLRKYFPKVQFVLTAHSPLVVAGCRRGEVALLWRENSEFQIVDFQRDFIGATPEEIYRLVFEIEERDVRFLELQARLPQLPELIRDLESRKRQPDADVSDLEDTIEAIKRTKEERKTRLTYEALRQENEQLRRQLEAVQRTSEGSGSV